MSLQRHGRWIYGNALNEKKITPPKYTDYWRPDGKEAVFWSTELYCSCCYHEAYYDTDYGVQLFKYCPNCGAKMDDSRGDGDPENI